MRSHPAARGDVAFGQTIEFGLVVDEHRAGSRGGDQLGMEFGRQRGLFHVELAHPVLVGIGQLRAGTDQLLVVAFDQAQLFQIELQRGARVVHGLHSSEELGIQRDFVLVRGQLGRDFFLDLLPFRIGVRLDQAEEDAADAGERFARAFLRLDGVSKVAGSGLSAILRISARCCFMPSSNAGR